MFGTVLSYISLRLLGVPVEDPACAKGLAFVRENGGGVMAPSWAKFWMAVLGVYEWEVRDEKKKKEESPSRRRGTDVFSL